MSGRPSSLRRQICEIWHIRIGEHPLPAPLLATLSEDERQRAARFVRAADRRRYQLCHVALRQILGDWVGEPPERLRFMTGRWGKPALAEPFADRAVEFNLSHTAGLGLIAVACGRRLGIDVEAIRPLGDMPAIARRVFSAADCELLAGLPKKRLADAFWEAWTANEACLKALGSGLGSGEPAIRLDRQAHPLVRDTALRLHRLDLDSPFVGALAVEGGARIGLVRRVYHLPACA